jgi:hypothetical protein
MFCVLLSIFTLFSAISYTAVSGPRGFEPAAHSRASVPGAGLAALATPSASLYATPVRGGGGVDDAGTQGGTEYYQSIGP